MSHMVGAIVHYTNLGDKDGKYPPQTQAAIITAIYEDTGDRKGTLKRVDSGLPKDAKVLSPIVDLKVFYNTGVFDTMKVPKRTESGQRFCWNFMGG